MYRPIAIATPTATLSTIPARTVTRARPANAGRMIITQALVTPPQRRAFSTSTVQESNDIENKIADFTEAFRNEGNWQMEDPFRDIAKGPFSPEIVAKLRAPVVAKDVEIRPDGMVYLPEVKYRTILLNAFGPGGWALAPRPSTRHFAEGLYSREYALFCMGQFVAQARGEFETRKNSFNFGSADEIVRSHSLRRCCKDLGIALELWDQDYVQRWKDEHAVLEWAEPVNNKYDNARKKIWRRKDKEFAYPWKSSSAPDYSASKSSNSYSNSNSNAASSSSNNNDNEALLDLDNLVPSRWKKVAGKTYRDLISSKPGRDYLEWLVKAGRERGSPDKIAEQLLELSKNSDGFETDDVLV